MKDAQILQKAIEKAGKNGFNWEIDLTQVEDNFWEAVTGSFEQYAGVIFSHDFAKAFWPEEADLPKGQVYEQDLNWQHHLQQMVLEKKPLKYLEKFL